VAARWSPAARVLAERFWPGPLTLVVECGEVFAPGVAAGDGSIGVRCSPHPVASALASGARTRGLGPVTATSLNRGGDPAARDRAEAARICGDEIPMLAGEAGGGAPSSVVDVRGSEPRLLREGPIPASALELR
jgi:L-threonylcarbamoyladenylate synthase